MMRTHARRHDHAVGGGRDAVGCFANTAADTQSDKILGARIRRALRTAYVFAPILQQFRQSAHHHAPDADEIDAGKMRKWYGKRGDFHRETRSESSRRTAAPSSVGTASARRNARSSLCASK